MSAAFIALAALLSMDGIAADQVAAMLEQWRAGRASQENASTTAITVSTTTVSTTTTTAALCDSPPCSVEMISVDGLSWTASQDFCRARGRRMCTYAEVCPDGEVGQPLGGASPGDVWSPIQGNDWIQVGVSINNHPCKPHIGYYGIPEWAARTNSYNQRVYCCAEDHITSAAEAIRWTLGGTPESTCHEVCLKQHLRCVNLTTWPNTQQRLELVAATLAPRHTCLTNALYMDVSGLPYRDAVGRCYWYQDFPRPQGNCMMVKGHADHNLICPCQHILQVSAASNSDDDDNETLNMADFDNPQDSSCGTCWALSWNDDSLSQCDIWGASHVAPSFLDEDATDTSPHNLYRPVQGVGIRELASACYGHFQIQLFQCPLGGGPFPVISGLALRIDHHVVSIIDGEVKIDGQLADRNSSVSIAGSFSAGGVSVTSKGQCIRVDVTRRELSTSPGWLHNVKLRVGKDIQAPAGICGAAEPPELLPFGSDEILFSAEEIASLCAFCSTGSSSMCTQEYSGKPWMGEVMAISKIFDKKSSDTKALARHFEIDSELLLDDMPKDGVTFAKNLFAGAYTPGKDEAFFISDTDGDGSLSASEWHAKSLAAKEAAKAPASKSKEVSIDEVCGNSGIDPTLAWEVCRTLKDVKSMYTGCVIDFCASGGDLEMVDNVIREYNRDIDQGSACSEVDGIAKSIFYPCRCGLEVCSAGTVCDLRNLQCLEFVQDCPAEATRESFETGPCICQGDPTPRRERALCSTTQMCKVERCVDVPDNCTAHDGIRPSEMYPCVCGEQMCGLDLKTLEICSSFRGTRLCAEAPPVCTETGGLDVSNTYPCSCGNAVCTMGMICNAMRTEMQCTLAPCTAIDGATLSRVYPCVCAGSICQETEACTPDGKCMKKCGEPTVSTGCLPGQLCGKSACDEAYRPQAPPDECSVSDGTSISLTYPCTCGSMVCQEDEACDKSDMGTCTLVQQCNINDNSSFSAAYPCKCAERLCIAGDLCDLGPAFAASASDLGTCTTVSTCSIDNKAKLHNAKLNAKLNDFYPCNCVGKLCISGEICDKDSGICKEQQLSQFWAVTYSILHKQRLLPAYPALAAGATAGMLLAGLLCTRWPKRRRSEDTESERILRISSNDGLPAE